jgi:hypothetical protein
MSRLTIVGILLSVAAFAACSNDSGAAGTTDMFPGKWSCTDQLTVKFTSPAGFPDQNVTQMSIMNITGSSGNLTASKEKEGGGSGCSVSFKSNGSSSATLNPGQTCMTEQGITLTYTSGTATASTSSFNSTFDFEGSGMLTQNGTTIAATVTGTQTTTCSRISAPPPSTSGGTTGGW